LIISMQFIGLTATPKKKAPNTYHLFQIEDDNPTFVFMS
jgi:type I site-specific restriction endonuclease